MPFVSCIVLSHDKAPYVAEAIGSLVAQTFPDWEAIVFDSGVLHDQGFFDRLPVMKDQRIRLVRSWETEELRTTKTIASWCFNECFRKKLVHGDYVTYLCDDDLLYPNAFQAFYDHAQANPGLEAMYASVDMTGLNEQGEKVPFGEIVAAEVKGSCCGGGALDCHVDYLQLCHRADVLDLFPNDEYWPENREVIRHADGVFLEQLGSLVPIHPLNVKIGENRKVPLSLNDGGERLQHRIQVLGLEEETHRLREAQLRLEEEKHCLEEAKRRLEEDKHHLEEDKHRLGEDKHRLEKETRRLQERLSALEIDNHWLRKTESDLRGCLRYRVADRLNGALKCLPFAHAVGKRLMRGDSNAEKPIAPHRLQRPS